MRKALLVAALTFAPAFSVASAQSLSVNISGSVQFPPVVQTAANLVNLLSRGVQVSFLTPTAQPAATLNQSGGIVVKPAYPTSTPITQVQVMTPIPGTTTLVKEIYPLAHPLNLSQPVQAQSIIVKAKDGTTYPLTSIMGRQAAWAKAPGLQKKPGGMPPGQLKQLCKKEPSNALCK